MTAPPAAGAVPDLADLREAARRLEGVSVRTPLIEAPELTRRLGQPVWVKCEQWQPIGAFKVRGAWTAVSRLSESARAWGILTHSSGNHGQAVAWAGRRLGARTVVVMPDSAPRIKVDAVRALDGEVVFCDRYQRAEVAAHLERTDSLAFIHPFEHADVILGQATCALEILEERPEIATLLAPVGGGGLLGGACLAAAALGHPVGMVGVEPEGAAKLTAALAAGRPVPLEHTDSLADGLLPVQIGQRPWSLFGERVREAVRIPDEAIGEAVRFLWRAMGLRVEPSGAITVAAILSGRLRAEGPVAAILSGGNVDPAVFDRLVS